MANENIVLIGSKDFMSYLRSVEFFLRKKRERSVILRARGQNIKKAVDLAEASKNKFMEDLNISVRDIKIYTSKFKDKNFERSVSCIDIEIISK